MVTPAPAHGLAGMGGVRTPAPPDSVYPALQVITHAPAVHAAVDWATGTQTRPQPPQ